MYRSSYAHRVHSYAALLHQETAAHRQTWCIFDNTASSAAVSDALALMDEVEKLTRFPLQVDHEGASALRRG
jgi:uncharacterized protein YecE (DUF72 family)